MPVRSCRPSPSSSSLALAGPFANVVNPAAPCFWNINVCALELYWFGLLKPQFHVVFGSSGETPVPGSFFTYPLSYVRSAYALADPIPPGVVSAVAPLGSCKPSLWTYDDPVIFTLIAPRTTGPPSSHKSCAGAANVNDPRTAITAQKSLPQIVVLICSFRFG